MKHYSMEELADFAHGFGESEDRARLAKHLDGGCPECAALADFAGRLIAICGGLASAEAPDSALRLAKAIFPARVANPPTRGTRLPIELIFDSFLVPAPAGFRATWQVGWQGLYRAGECSVDVRIEPELKSPRAAVIGQISNHAAPEQEMGNLPVSLLAGKQVIAETFSNRFGEFQMEYEQQPRLKLCIHLRDTKVIQVPLKKLASDQPAAKSRAAARKR